MSEECNCGCSCCCDDAAVALQVGDDVPDFKVDIFDPSKKDFGEISLVSLKEAGKWTILFFYPGDFTFV